MAAGFLTFQEIVDAFQALGHDVVYRQVPAEVYAAFFPAAEEMAQMFGYWTEFTYMGPGAEPRLALAEDLAIRPLTRLQPWLKARLPARG